MSPELRKFWNRYTKLKNQVNWKPSHGVIIWVPISIKNHKLRIRQFSKECVLRHEVSSMMIHGFRAKWRMLCPHSWYSFLKYAGIGHKRVSWNREQCCRRKFSFSFHAKIIFYFWMRKMGYFVKQLPKISCKVWALNYLKILYPMYV